MAKVSKIKQPKIIELHIVLKPTSPQVWRRLWVRDSVSMYELHEILQVSMGWMHSHLFMFRAPGVTITEPSPDYGLENETMKDARKIKLSSVLQAPKDSVEYEYDFGDSWTHTVTFERVVDEDEVWFNLPRCVAGENACPPEDCGGFPGFDHLKEVIADSSHEEHVDIVQWLDQYYPNYDPREFSLGVVNKILKIGASKYLRHLAALY